jgi:hypothetical protein
MWIARDKNGNLFLYEEKPYLIEDRYFSDDVTKCHFVAKTAFKNITFENSPQQINFIYEELSL